MAQKIKAGSRVWVGTAAASTVGPVVRDRQYAGTVLRQNPYETAYYPVRLDLDGSTRVVNDSMLHSMAAPSD